MDPRDPRTNGMPRAAVATKMAVWLAGALTASAPACTQNDGLPDSSSTNQTLSSATRAQVAQAFAERRWSDALNTCTLALFFSPGDCAARYCVLLGRSMVFVDSLNNYLLPRLRSGASVNIFDVAQLWVIDLQLRDMASAADSVTAGACQYDLPHLPLQIGDAADPIVLGDVRGLYTPRGAYLLGAIANSIRYTLATLWSSPSVPSDQSPPGLPELLERMRTQLLEHDRLLFAQPVKLNPDQPQGGYLDRDGNCMPSAKDELLIDIFKPGTDERVFDFSGASLVQRETLPAGALTPTASLPPPRCGYKSWHIDTILPGQKVGTTDGMSFSPDGQRLALPMVVDGKYQIHLMNVDGSQPVCITCTPGSGANDGVRFRPRPPGASPLAPDALIFISNRDHPYAVGGAGGGAGQELYAMRPDGSQVTRLTKSGAWATNYHVNFSPDGTKIAWGSTDQRTWDVLVADFDDTSGFHLSNIKRLPRDTTWWEPHGISPDGGSVIASNSRAGLLSSDIYAVEIASGRRTRLTADLAWDEHAHLSPPPYARKLAWMSGRARPASVQRLNDGSLSPIFDFFWIAPGVYFEFANLPAGYTTELYIADADGNNIQQLTNDGQVVADNQWSPDGTKIIFRQSEPKLFGTARVRILSFDDCYKR